MPEDIKKEAIDNETAENKAEEIEIEGADEESTQAAEEAKDTDMNETESDDDALADAEAKADDKSDEKKGLFKKKKKDKKDEQIEELNDRLKRQMAEFENFRKRTDKEKQAMFDTGAKSVIEKILPVVDIRLYMGKPALEYNSKTCFIVLNVDDLPVCIVVDSVQQVIDIDLQDVRPIPIKRRQKLLDGMITLENGTVLMSFDCKSLVSS